MLFALLFVAFLGSLAWLFRTEPRVDAVPPDGVAWTYTPLHNFEPEPPQVPLHNFPRQPAQTPMFRDAYGRPFPLVRG